jgi:hypothetical protein
MLIKQEGSRDREKDVGFAVLLLSPALAKYIIVFRDAKISKCADLNFCNVQIYVGRKGNYYLRKKGE